jgi:hypothetical protein
MYASPASLLRLPPPKRRVIRGKFAPVGRVRPEVGVWRILVALLERVNCGELRLRPMLGRGCLPAEKCLNFTLYHS